VSARANALAVRTEIAAPALLRALNGISPEIFFTAAAGIPETLKIRHAVRRVYRYYEPWAGNNPERWSRAGDLFAGPVDTRSFGRGVSLREALFREVEAVTVTPVAGGLVIEVRGRSFAWGMVRKIVGALREHDAGRLSLPELEAAVRGRRRLTLPLAEPERLLLWDVVYPFGWEHRWTGPNRHQRRWGQAARDGAWARSGIVHELTDPGR